MPKVYDDWERLVRATVRRDELWQLCHDHSRTPSGGSSTSGSTSPIPELPLRTSTARLSPLNRDHDVAPKTSSTRISPLNPQVVLQLIPEVVSRSSSAPVSPSKQGNRQGLVDKEKSMMRRSKSRMRMDRWVWTRWLSNTFTKQKTVHA